MKQADSTTSGKAGCCTAASENVDAGAPGSVISPEERHNLIVAAAYGHAECRGFAEGCEMEDWLTAEAEIDQRLKQS